MQQSRRATALALCLFVATFCACSKEEQGRKAIAAADAYAAAGKNDEAILEYRRAIQLNPKDGNVRLKLANTFLKVGANTDALREFLRAGDLLPDNAAVQITIGNLLLANERFEDARTRADQVLKRQPGSAAAHVLRGNALAHLNQSQGAVQSMEQAISAEPDNAVAYIGLGMIQRARGEIPQAEQSFKKALEVEPNSPDIRISYANFLLASSRQADAERELKRAHDLDPQRVSSNQALATFYVVTGQRALAEAYLKILSATPESASWAGFVLARYYVVAGRHDDAIRVLRGLITAKTDRRQTPLEARLQLAAILYNRKQRDEAHRLVDEVIATLPKEPRALTLKAGFLLDEEKFDDAIRVATLATQNSRAAQPNIVLGLAYGKVGKIEEAKKAFTAALSADARSIAAQIELSRLSLLTGDAAWAQKYGEQALRAAPELPAAREAVVRAALARGDLQAAGPPLAALRRDRPDDPKFLYFEGELRMQEGKKAAARQALVRAAELEPGSLTTANALIRLELSEGNVAAARGRAEKVVKNSPKDPAALLLAARTYATSNDFSRAESLMRQAIDLDPGRSQAYGMLANLYLVQNKLEDALAQYRDSAKREPKSVGAQTMVGTVLAQMGRRAEAKEAYRQALQIDPKAAIAANNLAFLYAEDGENLDTAVQLAEIAKAQMPGFASAIDTLGWVYYNRKMPTYAVAQLQDAVAIEPANAEFHYHLGLAHARGGDAKQARETLDRALKMDPRSPLANDARNALATLKK